MNLKDWSILFLKLHHRRALQLFSTIFYQDLDSGKKIANCFFEVFFLRNIANNNAS